MGKLWWLYMRQLLGGENCVEFLITYFVVMVREYFANGTKVDISTFVCRIS